MDNGISGLGKTRQKQFRGSEYDSGRGLGLFSVQ